MRCWPSQWVRRRRQPVAETKPAPSSNSQAVQQIHDMKRQKAESWKLLKASQDATTPCRARFRDEQHEANLSLLSWVTLSYSHSYHYHYWVIRLAMTCSSAFRKKDVTEFVHMISLLLICQWWFGQRQIFVHDCNVPFEPLENEYRQCKGKASRAIHFYIFFVFTNHWKFFLKLSTWVSYFSNRRVQREEVQVKHRFEAIQRTVSRMEVKELELQSAFGTVGA